MLLGPGTLDAGPEAGCQIGCQAGCLPATNDSATSSFPEAATTAVSVTLPVPPVRTELTEVALQELRKCFEIRLQASRELEERRLPSTQPRCTRLENVFRAG